MARSHSALAGFEEEPGPPLGFIDPNFKEAGGGNVAVFIADVVSFAEVRGQRLIVLAQLGKHILRLDVLGVIVCDAL